MANVGRLLANAARNGEIQLGSDGANVAGDDVWPQLRKTLGDDMVAKYAKSNVPCAIVALQSTREACCREL